MQATSPAGHRRPGAGNTVTQTLMSLSHTPLTGWGRGRLQDTEAVLPAQVCAKPLTPMTTGLGRESYMLVSLKEIPFSLEDFAAQI